MGNNIAKADKEGYNPRPAKELLGVLNQQKQQREHDVS